MNGTANNPFLPGNELNEPLKHPKGSLLSAKEINNREQTDIDHHINSNYSSEVPHSTLSTNPRRKVVKDSNAENIIVQTSAAIEKCDENSFFSRSDSNSSRTAHDTALDASDEVREISSSANRRHSRTNYKNIDGSVNLSSSNSNKNGEDVRFTNFTQNSLFDTKEEDELNGSVKLSSINSNRSGEGARFTSFTENSLFDTKEKGDVSRNVTAKNSVYAKNEHARAAKKESKNPRVPAWSKKLAVSMMYERMRRSQMSRKDRRSTEVASPLTTASASSSSCSSEEKAKKPVEDVRNFPNFRMPKSEEAETSKNDDGEFVEVALHSNDPEQIIRRDIGDDLLSYSTNERTVSVPFTPLDYIPYAHGGFSAAAPLMIHDQKWMRILRRVLPESHADAVTILCQERKKSQFPNSVRIMKWAENNPIVAAYGILNSDAGSKSYRGNSRLSPRSSNSRSFSLKNSNTNLEIKRPTLNARQNSLCFPKRLTDMDAPNMKNNDMSLENNKGHIPALEWDVFLDPNLVRNLERALEVADECKMAYEKASRVAASANVERLTGCLINRMVLSHGSTSQLAAEAMGFNPKFNFARVVEQGEQQRLYRRSRKTEFSTDKNRTRDTGQYLEDFERRMLNLAEHIVNDDMVVPFVPGKGRAKAGGMFVEHWLTCFVKALKLALDPSSEDQNDVSIMFNELEKSKKDTDLHQIKPPMCGVFLCLGYDDPNSTKADHTRTSMAESVREITRLLGTRLRIILDLKSRRVSPRVWAHLVNTFCSHGLHIEGIGSFDIEELRSIGHYVSPLVQKAIFFHSAGDLQRAIHANEVKHGDTVYFNAGSLIWTKPTSFVSKLGCCHADNLDSLDDIDDISREILFHPCAYPSDMLDQKECKATLQDYQRKLDLRIGCYVQEFSISDSTLNAISELMNKHSSIYNLGLAWGGVNGRTVRGVVGDGYWNQRYMGQHWDMNAEPSDIMNILHIEDHHLVKKALRASAWGPVGMVNPVNDVGGDATGQGARLNFESFKPGK